MVKVSMMDENGDENVCADNFTFTRNVNEIFCLSPNIVKTATLLIYSLADKIKICEIEGFNGMFKKTLNIQYYNVTLSCES